MHGNRRVNIELANHLFKTPIKIFFIRINEDLITKLIEALNHLKLEVKTYYEHDELLLKETDYFINNVKLVAGTIWNYSTYFRENNEEIIKYFNFTNKKIYIELFQKFVKPIIELIRILRNEHKNGYINKLEELIHLLSLENESVIIITKEHINQPYIEICNKKINILTDKEFIVSGVFVDYLIFIGTPSYYDRKFSEVFYGKEVAFLGYSCFENRLIKRKAFADLINESTIINTVYKDLIIDKGLEGIDYQQTFNTPLYEQDVEKLITHYEENGISSNDRVEARLVDISNGLHIFLPVGQNVNVLDRETLRVYQATIKTIKVGDLLVFRSHNGSNLVREVADQILGKNAKIIRENLEMWKRRLRKNINKKGLSVVSKILYRKYKITNATENNIKNWISTCSIRPKYLKEILNALKFKEREKDEILRSANLILRAHISAGHKISQALMEEISLNSENILDENGFYIFKSKKFHGATFNIEEVKKISKDTYFVSSYDVLKVLKR
ncbi:hypothetical protein [Bacillus massilinigeriensis]|uniref:hypothetical protein n=1 Tax=Bacillus massilionigeriensis TaxID=1805475 RepID=UPI00096B324E|nr:hypothetical protein [Bacillus massilionigeriensis]